MLKTKTFLDAIDPRPRKVSKSLNNYDVALDTVSFSRGYAVGFGDGILCKGATSVMTLDINRLRTKFLNSPLSVIVEPDDEGFIAKAPDLPLFGYGDSHSEALDNLKIEIESLYDDLMEDDDFSEDWLQIKQFLSAKVKNY